VASRRIPEKAHDPPIVVLWWADVSAPFEGFGPDAGHVVDYFQWRQSDAARGALNGWCY